jgi:tetratricopeptide (TPR) repeat protein
MGWPAYLLSLGGTWLLARRGRAGLAAALVPVAAVLVNGMLRTAQERYVLPALPILFVGAAAAIEWGRERWAARGTAIAISLAALCVAWPVPEFLAIRRAQALPDTRHLARRWINENIDVNAPMGIELYGPVFQPGERAMVIWPFFATQVPRVRPAYHWQMLDGLEYYVLSGEISRRFEADSANYPVECAYYRWIRTHAAVVWQSDPTTTSGPRIEVRRIPAAISTREERDSVFALAMPRPSGVSRVALWCFDASQAFQRIGVNERAEEWARRGLRVGASSLNARLCGALAFADLKLGDFEEAERVASEGARQYPREPMLHLYRAMALHEMGQRDLAVAEFRTAHDLSSDPRVLLNLGAVLSELGRFEEAVEALSRVPQGHGERAVARRDMGVILINYLGRPDEGIEALREAARLEKDPGQAKLLSEEVERLEAEKRKATAKQ